jgi:serine/threonine-protein kinase
VIGSDPAAGLKVKPDTAVDLFVSKGPKPIKVPDFTGKGGAKAVSALTELGFDVQRSDEFDDTVPKGRVVSQSPDSGELYKGDEVELVVSKGPEVVAVPNVLGSGYQAAKQTLEAAGFVVEIAGTPNFGGVYATDPPAGTELRKGSTVRVFVI